MANQKSNPSRIRRKGKERTVNEIAKKRSDNQKNNPRNNPKNNPRNNPRSNKNRTKNLIKKAVLRMQFAEYDESSKHPPTKDQVHFSGLHTSNVKAAICASQPPDPKETMLFLEEPVLELKVKAILEFIFDNFTGFRFSKILKS